MSEPLAIKVENVSKTFRLPHEKNSSLKSAIVNFHKHNTTYEKQLVLDDVSFEVKQGEFYGIVGRNGSGKSTILKLLAGIYSPSQGAIKVNGRLTPFIELGVGFNPELTGRENVYLNGALLGFNRKEMDKMYKQIVDFAELERFMDQKLKNYSSGMQVRLAFSIAIRAQNDILLIDEVLAVGDASFQRKCFDYFIELKRKKSTVILVTHDMGAVQEFCDRVLMLQDSKVIEIGAPRDVARRYEVVNSPNADSASKAGKLKRPANPEIKIEEIRLMLGDKPSEHFSVRDDIDVKITIKVNRPLEIQMNCFFIKSDSSYLAGINSTKQLGKDYKPSKGKHVLTCRIKAGQLIGGDYSVGLGIYTPGYSAQMIDVVDSAYDTPVPRLTIIDKSTYQDGEFYINGEWLEN
ncbi:MAG TPA: ABC transporter ATP-binding protein [Candidatus Sulfotelmatobacter sp.]|nr:ABC transporter ATP-binding protein [Candidatus Sulfotelmatobacter sp.]